MKIALLGYGRMGKEIEKIAVSRGHEIVIKKDQGDVVDIISLCLQNAVPVVSGTTGWLEKYEDAVELCNQNKGGFIYASNFSLGVNIFFEINKQLAKMMDQVSDYTTAIEEIHHTKKLDAPSGTAITLAEGIIDNSKKSEWEFQ